MKLILLLGLITFSISANVKDTVRGDILKLLPLEINSLRSNTTRTEIDSKFKTQVKSQDEDAVYLKDRTTIGIKKNRFHYAYVVATPEMKEKTIGLFRQVYSKLPSREKTKIEKSLSATDHNAGRAITMEVPGENLRLEFLNNESKTLRSVVIWPMDGEHP